MKQFRKKPVVIEAMQWKRIGDFPLVNEYRPYGAEYEDEPCEYCGGPLYTHGWIATLEGGHIVCPGDWIIKGVAGEFYPCKPDIFEQTYEPVTH